MSWDWEHLPTVQVGNLDVWDVRSIWPDRAPGYDTRALSDVDIIVVHHSADTSIYANGSRDTEGRLAAIYRYHTETHGWPGTGYHFVVDNWGHRFLTGGAETVRYHVSYKNQHSVGICLLGNYEYYVPSMWALLSLRELVANICQGLGKSLRAIGHGEYADPRDPTSCPGSTWPQWHTVIDPSLMPGLVGGDFYDTLLREWLVRNQPL